MGQEQKQAGATGGIAAVPAFETAHAPPDKAPAKAAMPLVAAMHGFVLADDPADCTLVLRECARKGCCDGVRPATPAALREAALAVPVHAVQLATSLIDNDTGDAAAASVCLLQAKTYVYLRNSGSELAGMSLAGTLAQTLVEMDEYCAQEGNPLAGIDAADSHFATEISFLAALWDQMRSQFAADRRAKLMSVADEPEMPLAQIAWDDPPPLQQEFLRRWSRAQPALLVRIKLEGLAEQLNKLWSEPLSDQPAPRLEQPVALHGATTLEDAARCARNVIANWQAEGRQRIGIVGYNRELVRRLHSLCLNEDVHITDTTGWAAGTLLAGDLLLATVETAAGKLSPGDSARQMELALSRKIHRDGGDWAACVRELRRSGAASGQFAAEIARLAGTLTHVPSPSRWLDMAAELAGSAMLGNIIADDPAGESILARVRRTAAVFEGCDLQLNAAEMTQLLRDMLLSMRTTTNQARSNITLVGPLSCRPGEHDALLLLGADAGKLPHSPSSLPFNDEIRAKLGLPVREDGIARMRMRTAAFVAASPACAAVWHGGTPSSPYLALLANQQLGGARQRWHDGQPGAQASYGRQAVLPGAPGRVHASSCDTLMRCPYRFYASNMLRLDSQPEDELFDPAAHGSLVHRICEDFHNSREDGTGAREQLRKSTEKILAAEPDPVRRRLSEWRWQPLLRDYAALCDTRFADGWRTRAVEHKIEAKLGGGIRLVGTIDRIEERAGIKAVVDLKTGNTRATNAAAGELPQLPLYAHMAGASYEQSLFIKLRIENGRPAVKSQSFGTAKDGEKLSEKIFAHIKQLAADGLAKGVPLPANGAAKTCATCGMEGLCRRGHWKKEEV